MNCSDEVSRSSSTSRLELIATSQIVKTATRYMGETSRAGHVSVSRTKLQRQLPIVVMNPVLYNEYLKDDLGSRMEPSVVGPGCDSGRLRCHLVEGFGSQLMLFARPDESTKSINCSVCEPFVLAVVSPAELLEAITATGGDCCEFPTLERLVDGIFSSAENPLDARRVLCVVGLDKQCLAHQRKVVSPPLASTVIVCIMIWSM